MIAYVPQDPHLFEGTIEEILDLGGLMQRGRNLLKQPKLRMLTNLFWGCLMDTKPSLEGIRYVYQEDNGKESPLYVLYYQKLLSFYFMSLRLL
ncbi:ABC-type multidrug transport system, ATPase component [Brevibacillus laterosporus GI-9]|nr:ABC-type multidrug transport system, ATPase component [Brevibacillus laterosporus GI-9]